MNRATFCRIMNEIKEGKLTLITTTNNNGSSHLIGTVVDLMDYRDDVVLKLNHKTEQGERMIYYIPYSQIIQVIAC